jgi:hypothetical protein
MSTDDLSPTSLPPLAWTSSSNSRHNRQEPAGTRPERKNSRTGHKAEQPTQPEVEFERTEHELDSIA